MILPGTFSYFIPAFEIILIASAVYYLLSFFHNTRAMDLAGGIIVFLALFTLARWLHFPVLQTLMRYFVNAAVIGLLIIFQPELRLALAKLNMRGKKFEEISEFDKFLESLCNSVYRMSERHLGALIVLENQDSLEEYAFKSVVLNAQFSSEIIESVFVTTSPLHDGAIIVRGVTVLAAAVILPLADDSAQISRSMGTRHRAALGIAQHSDAISIVVSEETGKVSIAREGIMTRGIKADRFKGVLRSIFEPPENDPKMRSKFKNWLGTWTGISKSS
ncbi:MAG: diadenylate cyclase CdaA [Chlamydia sp.]